MKTVLKYYFVLIFYIGFLDCVKFRCDYTFDGQGWYKYHEMPSTWRDARLRCHLEGAILASPTTPRLLELMRGTTYKDIFTGFHAFSKGSFYSVDGIPLSSISHQWGISEPDNKNNAEDCITLNAHHGKLADARCDQPRPYVCYRKYSEVDVTVCGTPDPEYHFEPKTNKCYKFHTKPRTFNRAHFACSAEGGHLAIINSETESQVIRDLFAQYPEVRLIGNFQKDLAFIGFHNWGESSDWTTVDGQTLDEAGFSKFSPGQPDNATAGEYCGSVYRSGLLNDLWCERHFAFICEKKPDYPETCEETEISLDVKTSEKTVVN